MKTNYAIRRPVVNAYLVRERDRRRWRDLGVMLLLILPLALSLFGYTWVHLQLLETGFQINRGERELGRLQEVERRLDLDRERLSSPVRVERVARERLGMAPPGREQVIFLTAPTDGGSGGE